MGSLFFPSDDYLYPDMNNMNSPYKEKATCSSSNSSQGIFENNVVYENIKRGLGFDTSSTTNDGADGNDWNSRARASPVVERLIFEELQSDIIEYANSIGVAMDPRQWTVEDTHKWLHWVGQLYHIGDLTSCLSFDGRTLCGFTEDDFIILSGAKDIGQKIAAQLDIWKNVTKMTPSAGSYHFQQQQAMNQKLGTVMTGRSNSNTPKLLDTAFWEPPTPQQFPTNTNSMPSQFESGTNDVNINRGSVTDLRSNNSFQPFTSVNQQLPFRQDLPQGRSTPRPTIPLDRFRSVREAYQDNGFISAEKYQEFTTMVPSRSMQGMFLSATQRDASPMRNPASTSTFQLNNIIEPKKEPSQLPAEPLSLTVPEPELPPLSTVNSDLHSDFPDVNLMDLKTEKNIEPCTSEVPMDTSEQKVSGVDKPVKKKSTKHPIHLWEFLKQLLHDGKDCIRWIDQEKGIFKIYNSQEVAKFWGERKNRPAMNYDKLSRSIRQYYKKGIIKKTSQGKRLVYQFCEGYL